MKRWFPDGLESHSVTTYVCRKKANVLEMLLCSHSGMSAVLFALTVFTVSFPAKTRLKLDHKHWGQ